MALGTITVGSDKLLKASAPLKVFQLSFTGETAYIKGTGTAGAEALVQAAVGETVTLIAIQHAWATTAKYHLHYDSAADAFKILDVNANDEAAGAGPGGTNYGGTTFYVTAFCI